MNTQVRRLFIIVLVMFCALALAVTNNHVFRAASLNADTRNARTILHAAETDRGPIIVAGEAIASSSKIDGTQRYQRSYPQGGLYAAVTGYFSSSFSQATGLEAAASQILSGESDALIVQRVVNLFTGKTRQGGGVTLTLNPAMQQVAAQQLGNRRGAVVALDVKTGAVLALYSSPSYDPNLLATSDTAAANVSYETLLADPAKPLYNRAINGDLYPPGSTFKILSTIALLEKGVATADTAMESPVSTILPGTTTEIANDSHAACGNGMPTLAEAFARSCNTTFVLASQQLSHDDLADIASRFGFGTARDIPLYVTPSTFPASTDASQLALSSIGQYDVRVTPMQMAQVAQTIANGGEGMHPYVIDQVVDADLQTQSTTRPQSLGQIISKDTASVMTSLMDGVVSAPYGTAQSMAIDGVPIAAKTGTAQVGDTGYTNAWVVGFAPANDPQIAFAVVVEGDETDPAPYGSVAAGPIARALILAGLQ